MTNNLFNMCEKYHQLLFDVYSQSMTNY